ncbi:hypothetical protein [Streptomyces sp. NPDC002599]|uniref:hypothetical protein n=1 Tax=Streptomyces sp. NPDC002599 TaxID=3154421 RepID=UPI003328F625
MASATPAGLAELVGCDVRRTVRILSRLEGRGLAARSLGDATSTRSSRRAWRERRSGSPTPYRSNSSSWTASWPLSPFSARPVPRRREPCSCTRAACSTR